MADQDNITSDETDGIIHFDSLSDNLEFTVELVNDAKRILRILTYDLENAIYDNTLLIQAVTALVKRDRHSEVRILIKESSKAVKNGHGLLIAARRFPSAIRVHNPLEEDEGFLDAFILADETGYIHKRDAQLYAGIANFHAPLRTRKLKKRFDAIWQKSLPDPNMNRLHL